MNKTAVALAVTGALVAVSAQAETTLYGSARVSVDYQKADVLRLNQIGDVVDIFDDGVWDVVNNSSRLGVKGSEDLGNGLSAIYQYEFGVDAADGGNFNSNRPRVLGLKGGFGTISLGNQWSPYYNVAGLTDVFNSGKSFANYLGPFRTSSSLLYTTPDLSGLSAQALIQMDGVAGEDSADEWQLNLKYDNGPFTAGVAYRSVETTDVDGYTVGLGYNGGNLSVGLTVEQVDDVADDYFGVVSYAFGANIIRVAYGQVQFDDGSDEDVNHYLLGFQHNLSKRSRIWVEYIGFNGDDFELDEPSTINFSGDSDAISIGMRHDF